MKAVMLMFDTLNRDFLSPYGCEWTHTPNFERLAGRSLAFDNFYAGSLPCMPARRELHTGCYNFLHRSWGPLEPFDDSAIERLKTAGVYTHLVSDHAHYWEDGGATYHSRYSSWQAHRGQEGDTWMGQVAEPEIPPVADVKTSPLWRQEWVNRQFLDSEDKLPQTLTINDGLDFMARNGTEDNWFLQIECFDPHEPFYVPEKYRELFSDGYDGPLLDWPNYGINNYTQEQTEHLNRLYAALLAMCDASLGRVLDAFDTQGLWQDTMLIVNTDHGFMLGEKDWMAKNLQPCYNEIARTPFFIWDPRSGHKGQRRAALAQTVDIPLTLLGYFGVEAPAATDGVDLAPSIESDTPVRRAGLYGVHSGHVNVTDGHATLMRAPRTPENGPLYDYTLMPTHMRGMFTRQELAGAELARPEAFGGCPVLKIPVHSQLSPYWYGDLLFDLGTDPKQEHPVQNTALEIELLNEMCRLMRHNKAPAEQFERMGLPVAGAVDAAWLAGPGALKPCVLPLALDEVGFGDETRKAVAILLSLAPSQAVPHLSAALLAAGPDLTPGAVVELAAQALPAKVGPMLRKIIAGFLRY